MVIATALQQLVQFILGASAGVNSAHLVVLVLENTFGQVSYIYGFGKRIILGVGTIVGAVVGTVYIPDNIYVPQVEQIRGISELAVVEYNYAEIITSQTEMPAALNALYGQGMVFVAVGSITAGIDFSSVTDENIRFQREGLGGRYVITLPTPKLLRCYLDESKTYIAVRRRSVFAPANSDIDNSARDYAISVFVQKALEQDILINAQDRTIVLISQSLEATNFRGNYRIEFDSNTNVEHCKT